MPYATQADIVEIYGEETLPLLDGAEERTIDAARVNRALSEVSLLIDSYLGGRYSPPIAPNPPILVQVAVDLAVARLSRRAHD